MRGQCIKLCCNIFNSLLTNYLALPASCNEFARTPMKEPLDGSHVRSQETLIRDYAAIRVAYGQHVVTIVA
jgi:hypothetical protein